jgi:hypothetical protein
MTGHAQASLRTVLFSLPDSPIMHRNASLSDVPVHWQTPSQALSASGTGSLQVDSDCTANPGTALAVPLQYCSVLLYSLLRLRRLQSQAAPVCGQCGTSTVVDTTYNTFLPVYRRTTLMPGPGPPYDMMNFRMLFASYGKDLP